MDTMNWKMNPGNYGAQPTGASVVPGSGGSKASGVVIPRNPCTNVSTAAAGKEMQKKNTAVRIGTWNVRTMLRTGKLENIKREMEKGCIDILGLCEVRWKDSGDYWSDNYRVVYSGGNESQRGVAIVMNRKIGRRVVNIEQVSDRILFVEIEAAPTNIVVIQVYMPTSNHSEEEVDSMYEELEEIIGKIPGRKHLIVMGDWNAVVGEGRDGYEVGEYGLGTRNDRGEKTVEFCRRKGLVITNTWFKHHPRRRYTWKRPGDTGRYQIDYIMVRRRFRNSVKNSHCFPGADADSDHNLVVMKCNVRFKRIKRGRRVRKWDVDALKGIKGKEYGKLVEETLREDMRMKTVKERWDYLKKGITRAAENTIGTIKTTRVKKPWVTGEMIRMMDERRKWKSVNTEHGRKMYRELNNKLRRTTDRAKEMWWKEQCDEMENFQKQGKMDALYKKVKELSVGRKGKTVTNIRDKTGNLLTEPREIQGRWREYVEELYGKEIRPVCLEIEEEGVVDKESLGPGLLNSEIGKALREMKANKAVGVDNIPVELLKGLGREGKKCFFELCRSIYEEGVWPEDFLRSILIPIPKKSKAVECKDYRTISLISHAAKVVLRVLNKRLESRANNYLGEDQFGFRKGKGTRDAIAVMRTLIERNIEHSQDVFACFVDLEKAFDRVEWTKLMEILQKIGVDWRDRRLIRNLYMSQTAQVRVADGESEWTVLGRGVRQGCPLSPVLFNLYAEEMVREAWEGVRKGVKVGGELITSVRFADDKAVISQSAKGLQSLLSAFVIQCERYGMKINYKKTKVMRFSKSRKAKMNVKLDGHKIEQVEHFLYLGSTLDENGYSSKDIRRRIALAKEAFMKRRELMTRSLDKDLRKRLVKILIWSVALYGSETWSLRKEDERRLEAFEMWVWRRMEKISWVDRKTNEEVLEMVGEERTLLGEIRRRQKKWLEEILRGNGMLKRVTEGRMLGKRGRGRKRIGILDSMKGGRKYEELKKEIV